MSAYLVIHVDVKNPDAYKEYMLHTPRIIHKFGGRFLVRGGDMVTLEGPAETLRLVVIEFPSLDQARAFYASEDYTRARRLREGGGIARMVAIDGYPAERWEDVLRESAKLELRS